MAGLGSPINLRLRESQTTVSHVRGMQNKGAWLGGLIQLGQTETAIGCLNEQAPSQLLCAPMQGARCCAHASQAWWKRPILTFPRSLTAEGPLHAESLAWWQIHATKTSSRYIPSALFSSMQATNQPLNIINVCPPKLATAVNTPTRGNISEGHLEATINLSLFHTSAV